MKISERFNREIAGERLLFSNKDTYTKEESELIVEVVAGRMSHYLYYTSLIVDFLPILTQKVLPNIGEEEMENEKQIIAREMDRNKKLPISYVVDENGYAHYSTKVKYGISEKKDYFSTILNYYLDANELEEVLNNEERTFFCVPNTEFLITANMLFSRYPKFYNDGYVHNLTEIVDGFDKRRILDKTERDEYTVARKSALKHMKVYCKNNKKQEKRVLKKTKKN